MISDTTTLATILFSSRVNLHNVDDVEHRLAHIFREIRNKNCFQFASIAARLPHLSQLMSENKSERMSVWMDEKGALIARLVENHLPTLLHFFAPCLRPPAHPTANYIISFSPSTNIQLLRNKKKAFMFGIR